MRALRFCAVACAVIGLAGPALHAATYQATDLYPVTAPSGYKGAYLGFTIPIGTNGVTGGQVGTGALGTDGAHAALWTAGGMIDLAPPDNAFTIVNTVNGSQSAGYGAYGTLTAAYHALLWTDNTAASMVDLHPAQLGFAYSYVLGLGGNQQVGYAYDPSWNHAILWTGSAASAIDLHPTNISMQMSEAEATDGVHQVGYGISLDDNFHALLWSGNASSTVDLNPTQFGGVVNSKAFGISGGQEVGEAYSLGSHTHAAVWNGTPESAVDLHPPQYTLFNESTAFGTNGLEQVGVADFRTAGDLDRPGVVTISHAMVWDGTAASAVDLQLLLPSNFASSTAYSIDACGDVFGIATDTSGVMHAIEWTPQVPEPSGLALLALGAAGMLGRR